MELKFEVYAKVKKSRSEVFDAVYNPKKLSGYFTTGGASGPLDEGKEVMWDFHDFPGAFPVQVKECVKNEKILIQWGDGEGGHSNVEFLFEELDPTWTKVKVKEWGWKEVNQKRLDQAFGQCMGWSQMVCALKVYVEYGKNLREFMY